jgi:hypothetical protein
MTGYYDQPVDRCNDSEVVDIAAPRDVTQVRGDASYLSASSDKGHKGRHAIVVMQSARLCVFYGKELLPFFGRLLLIRSTSSVSRAVILDGQFISEDQSLLGCTAV